MVGVVSALHLESGANRHISRRTALTGSAVGLLAMPTAVLALFESPEALAMQSMATAQPKLRGLITEVSEVKRRRVKMAVDMEDDAYVRAAKC